MPPLSTTMICGSPIVVGENLLMLCISDRGTRIAYRSVEHAGGAIVAILPTWNKKNVTLLVGKHT